MKNLNQKLLKQFISHAAKKLDGEWVLLGGTILPLLGVEYRSTSDIDIIPISEVNHNARSLVLMDIAVELGLPVESINQAA